MRRRRSEIDLGEVARLVPAAGVVVVWIVLMFRSGGFHPGTWLPAGLVLAVLLGLAVLGGGRLLPEAGDRRTALLALLAFTAWCFASMLWSDARGLTWEAANLLLVAVLGAWTLALAPWRTRTAQGLGVLLACGAAAACLAALLSALSAADLTSRFEDFRFSPPLDYPNTTAAFAFMAAIPALLLASRPDASIPAKALAQGLATFLCAYALLPQSRGSILGGTAAVIVLMLAVGFRWRLFIHVLLLVVTVAAAAGPIADVYTAASQTGEASGALRDAFTAMLIATAAGSVLGLLLALAEDRLDIEDEWGGTARRVAMVAGALAAVAMLALGVAKAQTIGDTVSDQWDALTHPGKDFEGSGADDGGGSRLTSTDPLERYDYWRVALDGFTSNPVAGMAAGGFEQRYALERRYPKPSRYPHNVFLKVLGDTGLVGVGLLAAFLLTIRRGLLRARARTTRERVVAATALATLAYFLAHGSFDWLEVYPVLLGPALALPLVALAVRERADRTRSARAEEAAADAPAPSLRAWAATGVVLALATLSLAPPWVSLRYHERASENWRADPARAYRDLDRAASLNPFDAQPLVVQGVIGLSRGDLETAREGFEGALERQQAWLPHFGLALLAADAGDRAGAQRELAAALELHPEDPVLPEVAERVLSQKEIDPIALLREGLSAPGDDVEPIS